MSKSIKKICERETVYLRKFHYYPTEYRKLAVYQRELAELGWNFYVVNQTRGHCYSQRIITIPLWAITELQGNVQRQRRLVQYILHECAHAYELMQYGKFHNHGKEFMDILIAMSPPELLVFEMTYKPKQMVAAGAVFCPDSLEF